MPLDSRSETQVSALRGLEAPLLSRLKELDMMAGSGSDYGREGAFRGKAGVGRRHVARAGGKGGLFVKEIG
jgi:hypothetical protein